MNHPKSYRKPDGVWVHILRQSDINTFRKCPDLFRRKREDPTLDSSNTLGLLGTCFHTFIERVLEGSERDTAHAVAQYQLDQEWEGAKQVGVQLATASDKLHDMCHSWHDSIFETLPESLGVEVPFTELFDRTDEREIWLQGTMDFVHAGGVIDWKTSAQSYIKDGWKHQRYAVQPTFYSWAAGKLFDIEDPTFEYVVAVKRKQVQIERLLIERTAGDWEFLKDELGSVCSLIESGLQSFPLGATDWWCSKRWCPAWSQCRGKRVPDWDA